MILGMKLLRGFSQDCKSNMKKLCMPPFREGFKGCLIVHVHNLTTVH